MNSTFRPRHIVIGQYLGFTALIVASLPGFFGGLIIPKAVIGLLGLLPIAIGINHLVNRDIDEQDVQTVAGEFKSHKTKSSLLSKLTSFFNPQIFNIAAVTIANGGDNIGIYLPLFASSNLPSLAVTLSVFFILIGVWCYIAYLLTTHPVISQFLTRYAKAVVPFVLIALGLFIIIESETYRLLLSLHL
ncbi:MAG TPA: cadmium resistance transporter [Kamptonema sp.]|nr:cadmium resistance transporter [Kamptonema sp.]